MDVDSEDDLMERILQDLRNVLENDPLVDEFDILPVHESMQNKSPVIHVMNKLALENWCVKPLYVYVYNKFFAWRNKKFKIDTDIVFMWTCAILLINPEIETVWNARKELICKSFNTLKDKPKLTEELKFSELVLSRKPKSSPVFAHRKWTLLKMKELSVYPEIIKQEFFVTLRMANLYANNYYAWSHRSWILQEILQSCLKSVAEELSQTELWVSTHISDHSGFHYRQFLLSCFRSVCLTATDTTFCALHKRTHLVLGSTEGKDNPCFLSMDDKSLLQQWMESIHKELVFLSNLQNAYPGHEALWYHRRYLLHEIETGVDTFFTKLQSPDNALQNKRLKSECGLSDVWCSAKEQDFLNHCCNVSANNNWERTLMARHIKWSGKVLHWPLSTCLS